MMKDKHLYCCSSYYQVYISLICALAYGEKVDLILETHGIETAHLLAKTMGEDRFSFVENVFVCDDSDKVDPYLQRCALGIPWQRRGIVKHMRKVLGDGFRPKEYKEIHVFWDLGYAGTWLNIQKIPYTLHEDSLNSYQHIKENRKNYAYIWNPKGWKFICRKHFCVGVIPFGFSKYCQRVIVNDKKDIQIPLDKVQELPVRKIEQSLTLEQKQMVFDLFMQNSGELEEAGTKTVLLLTEPFFVTKRLPSEELQIALYRQIMEQYAKNHKVLIKPHPRDSTDYNKYFPEICVMEKNIPMEVLNFSDQFQVNKAITVTSSAVYGIQCADEKLYLGPEVLKQFQSME